MAVIIDLIAAANVVVVAVAVDVVIVVVVVVVFVVVIVSVMVSLMFLIVQNPSLTHDLEMSDSGYIQTHTQTDTHTQALFIIDY